MAVAFIALLAALSGTAVALPGKNTVDSGDLKRNAVKTRDIARNAVTGPKIRNGAVNGRKVRNNSLTGTDINEGTLGQVPSANAANTANTATTATTATTANSLAPPEGFHQVGAPGEPPFLNGCTPHSLGVPGVEVESPGFYKDHEGRVHLKGVYACPATNAVAFQLPPGYRPANNRILTFAGFCINGCTDSPTGDDQRTGLVAIIGAGSPVPNGDGAVLGDGTQMSLDGISFRAGG